MNAREEDERGDMKNVTCERYIGESVAHVIQYPCQVFLSKSRTENLTPKKMLRKKSVLRRQQLRTAPPALIMLAPRTSSYTHTCCRSVGTGI